MVLILIVERWRRASAAGRRQLVPVMFAGAVGLATFAIDEITFIERIEAMVAVTLRDPSARVGYIPGRHEILQLVVPDLPSEFPPLRLAEPDPPAPPRIPDEGS